jgi:hypothetical protein
MHEPIHITIPGRADDPRDLPPAPPGVIIHRTPPLHPDDVTVVNGLPVTTPARTLVDLAEIMDQAELRNAFLDFQAAGHLEIEAVKAARARVEWRPSLAMLDEVIAEFDE